MKKSIARDRGAAVYTHRDPRQLLAQLTPADLHRLFEIPVYANERDAPQSPLREFARQFGGTFY